ncbi:uncharacterized protein LOC135226713 [Macrobrachium nipponense]|uniref:uncharacterized protein LOC135226713 n=1 Tax=Macrobrachium nipponense TaxID=159736 RepID=UPI0030C8C18D
MNPLKPQPPIHESPSPNLSILLNPLSLSQLPYPPQPLLLLKPLLFPTPLPSPDLLLLLILFSLDALPSPTSPTPQSSSLSTPLPSPTSPTPQSSSLSTPLPSPTSPTPQSSSLSTPPTLTPTSLLPLISFLFHSPTSPPLYSHPSSLFPIPYLPQPLPTPQSHGPSFSPTFLSPLFYSPNVPPTPSPHPVSPMTEEDLDGYMEQLEHEYDSLEKLIAELDESETAGGIKINGIRRRILKIRDILRKIIRHRKAPPCDTRHLVPYSVWPGLSAAPRVDGPQRGKSPSVSPPSSSVSHLPPPTPPLRSSFLSIPPPSPTSPIHESPSPIPLLFMNPLPHPLLFIIPLSPSSPIQCPLPHSFSYS